MSAMPRVDTEVNGMDVSFWAGDDSQPVREFAAAVGRDHDGIKWLETSTRGDVEVWIRQEPDVEHSARLPTPDGFEVEHVSATKSGGICVRYNRVEQ